MSKRIQKLVAGQTPTLIETMKGNEVIDAINEVMSSKGLYPIEVKCDSRGRLTVDLPGFTPTEIILCRNGEPVNGSILFNDYTLSAGIPTD